MIKDFDIPYKLKNAHKKNASMKFLTKYFAVFLIILASLITIIFLSYRYIAPFGAKITYIFSADKDKDKVSKIAGAVPSENIENGASNTLNIPQQIIRQNIVTFNLKLLSKKIEGVWINFKFKGKPDEIKVGVKGVESDKYLYKPLYNKTLDGLRGSTYNNDLLFWQKGKTYNDLADFVKKPPDASKTIVSYFVNPSDLLFASGSEMESSTKISAVVNKVLRGDATFFIKVNKKPFILNIEKQDANTYADPDILGINIYQGDNNIIKKEIADDGITDASRLKLQPQKLSIKIDNPIMGVYKIVLDDKTIASDIRINKLETNEDSIIFSYPILITDQKPSTIWTNAQQLTFITAHTTGIQKIRVDKKEDFSVDKDGKIYTLNMGNKNSLNLLHQLDMPKNDLVINGDGYFTFDKDSFFNPDPFNMIPLSETNDFNKVDYLIANYKKVKIDGEWKVAQVYFDPKDIKIDGDKLYFSLEIPELADYGGEIAIDSLEVTVDKPGWFDSAKQNLSVEQSNEKNSGNNNSFVQSITQPITETWDKVVNFFKGLWPFGGDEEKDEIAVKETKPEPTEVEKKKIKLEVLNGGAEPGTAGKFAVILKDNDFTDITTGNIAVKIYKEATIKYKEDKNLKSEREEYIQKLTDLLKKESYKVTQDQTATRSSVITVILGVKQSATPKPTLSITSTVSSSPSATPKPN